MSLGLTASLALFVAPGASSARPLEGVAGAASDDGTELRVRELRVRELRVRELRVRELRARGPAALEELLARYRHESRSKAPSELAALEATIDAVAGQRYATVSGLYWYTDLALAERAAQELHRPILALRMLGDLREDLSCANSRLFRATLYANTELSAFLRSHFVLYWSSERAVPRVTIDFGDGRKLERTTTGNSAHYVLDENGHVLDVLPGLYAPAVFESELRNSLALARQVRGMTDAQRIRTTAAYHATALAATERAWQRADGTQYIRGSRYLLGRGEVTSALARAQAATMSKMVIEVPDLQRIGLMEPGDMPNDQAAWSAIGQKVWRIGDPDAPSTAPARAVRGPRAPVPVPPSMVLDEASRTLVARLHSAGAAEPVPGAELAAVIARLEQHIVADTALNQFQLRQTIHRRIAERRETDFTALNAWIYDKVFATPKSDPWLGLHPRTTFTGLPGDGAVSP